MFQKKAVVTEKDNKKTVVKKKKGGDIKTKLLTVLKVIVFPTLFAGIVVCGLYLSMQNKLEAESLKEQVLIMRESVAANTFVKYEDADKYFTSVAVEKIAIPPMNQPQKKNVVYSASKKVGFVFIIFIFVKCEENMIKFILYKMNQSGVIYSEIYVRIFF